MSDEKIVSGDSHETSRKFNGASVDLAVHGGRLLSLIQDASDRLEGFVERNNSSDSHAAGADLASGGLYRVCGLPNA